MFVNIFTAKWGHSACNDCYKYLRDRVTFWFVSLNKSRSHEIRAVCIPDWKRHFCLIQTGSTAGQFVVPEGLPSIAALFQSFDFFWQIPFTNYFNHHNSNKADSNQFHFFSLQVNNLNCNGRFQLETPETTKVKLNCIYLAHSAG